MWHSSIIISISLLFALLYIYSLISSSSSPSSPSNIIFSDFSLSPNTSELRSFASLAFIQDSTVKKMHGNNPVGMYNLSVLKTDSGFKGVIRGTSCDGCRSSNPPPLFSYVYYIELDNNADTVDLRILDLDYQSLSLCNKFFGNVNVNGIEDPKIFFHSGDYYVISNVLGSSLQPYPCSNTMCIYKLSSPKSTFTLLHPPPFAPLSQKQKNWSPFSFDNRLLVEYSVNPHIILEIDLLTGSSSPIYNTSFPDASSLSVTGHSSIHCGPPPVLLPNNQFLAIGHQRVTHGDYTHFFYTFEAHPPFGVTSMSHHFKLDSYSRIQFAAGISLHNNIIYISYGIDDCENRIFSSSLERVLDLLRPVTYSSIPLPPPLSISF